MSYRGIKLLREKNDNWSVWSSKVENRLRKVGYAWSWVEGAQKPESVGDREWEKAKYEALDIIQTANQYLGGFQAARAKCQEIGWNFGCKDDEKKQVLVSKGENLKYEQGLSRSKQSVREQQEIHSGLIVREERRCYKCKSKKHLIGSCPKLTDREKREYRKRTERIKRYKGKLHELQKQPERESESESSDCNACVAYDYDGYSSIDSDSD